MLNRIGLGTAQFGSAYGISNRIGQPTAREIDEILELAWLAGVGVLDTAPAYGSAEREIGRYIGHINGFRVVTKTLPIAEPVLTCDHAYRITERFMRSLDFLCVPHVQGLMVHHADLMLRPGAEYVAEALHGLRDQGLVTKIGVSVYDGAEIDAVFERFAFDLVQVPLSIADQRLLRSGHLARLKRRGVEIHARSVFLQGMLLMPSRQLPVNLAPIAPQLDRFAQACQRGGRSPIEACLQFALEVPEIDCFLVGANRVSELADILAFCRSHTGPSMDFASLAFEDTRFLNPARWAQLHRGGGL